MNSAKQRWTFISYSRQDKDFALELARELKSAGYLVWLDQLDIPTGARWDDEVERALKECGIFLIILTPASVSSENVKDEIGYAIDNGKRILPVLLKECTVPLRLRRFQYVDFTKMKFNEGIKRAEQLLHNLITEWSTHVPSIIIPETENVPKTAKTALPSVPVQGDSPSRTLVSIRTRIFALTAAVFVLIIAVGVMKLLSLSSSPSNNGNQNSSVQITVTANSPIVPISSATSTSDPAGCRLSQDTFSQTDHWGDDSPEWGEWGHVNGAYRMRLQHPGGILKRAWSETEVPESFRVSVATLVIIPGGTWGIYYFDTGQNW
nr:toll/interleukin-1 receptor domain-containing protein [Chloroflexota bacterium]